LKSVIFQPFKWSGQVPLLSSGHTVVETAGSESKPASLIHFAGHFICEVEQPGQDYYFLGFLIAG